MRTVRALLPLALALAAFGALVWFLLGRESAWGRWLLAFFLVAHGGVHVFFLVPRPKDAGDDWPFDLADAWPARAGLPVGAARAVAGVLFAMMMAGYVLGALATVGALVPAAWWPTLVAAGSLASAVLLALAFKPMLLLGLFIDAALLWLALASGWTPGG